jgi:hypothetical protein
MNSSNLIYLVRRMLTIEIGALDKGIKVEILYWKMVKSDKFNFLKVKIMLEPMQTCYFWLP